MQTIKLIGKNATLISQQYGGPKVPMKPGDTLDVEKIVAEDLLKRFPNRFCGVEARAKAVVSDKKVQKDVAAKVEKHAPKKAAKK